jgi:predicted RNase H-like nuclease
MSWIVVGVDCATQEERTGLAYGVVDDQGLLALKRVTLGTAGESAAATVASWIGSATQYVVALSAPLGWPLPLGEALVHHRAGDPLEIEPEQLFRRETDRFMQAEIGKQPPDVGADRVARTARAALQLLRRIRAASQLALPLAWEPGAASGVIEVHPAATLRSRNISATGYKVETPAGRKARSAILERLRPELLTTVSSELLTENDDLLDAVVCTVAAADFARGDALPPLDRARAQREGWIWFRSRGQRKLF